MKHTTRVTLEGRVDVVLLEPGKHHTIVAQRPDVRVARGGVFMSRPGSGLALVGPWSNDEHVIPFILGSIHAATEIEDPVAVVVGTRGRGEGAEVAAARARGVKAIIEDDEAAWVACATDCGGLADVEAYLHYLNAMHGWGCFVSEVDGAEDDDAKSAVLAFQEEYNRVFQQSILEDGVCGKQQSEKYLLREPILSRLNAWKLPAEGKFVHQSVASMLQSTIDGASLQGLRAPATTEFLGTQGRGYRQHIYELDGHGYTLTDLATEDLGEQFKEIRKIAEKLGSDAQKAIDKAIEAAEKAGEVLSKGKRAWKVYRKVSKFFPLAYSLGYVHIKYVGSEGGRGGPQEEPWEAFYGFLIAGSKFSKSFGNAKAKIELKGTARQWGAEAARPEDLEGMVQYLEGSAVRSSSRRRPTTRRLALAPARAEGPGEPNAAADNLGRMSAEDLNGSEDWIWLCCPVAWTASRSASRVPGLASSESLGFSREAGGRGGGDDSCVATTPATLSLGALGVGASRGPSLWSRPQDCP